RWCGSRAHPRAAPRCGWPAPARRGWSRPPSARRSPPRPGSPGRCCGRTCTRRLAQVDDPLAQVRRTDAVGHVLAVDRAGRVIVTADAADPAGDEVRVPRVLALHEDAVAAEDGRGAVA